MNKLVLTWLFEPDPAAAAQRRVIMENRDRVAACSWAERCATFGGDEAARAFVRRASFVRWLAQTGRLGG